MLQLLFCLFGLHGATEVDYTADDEEIKVCRDVEVSKKNRLYGLTRGICIA